LSLYYKFGSGAGLGDLLTTFRLRVGLCNGGGGAPFFVLEEAGLGLIIAVVGGVPFKSFGRSHCLVSFLGSFTPLNCSIVVRGGRAKAPLCRGGGGALTY